ncbi:MAG TPA: glycosyltransferase family 9 protein [Candidatus Hydrogenedentes bacterium]|nr:glycosyltransferase family 9 protein [Candidatus Hydrogenedentota bacterium]
MLNGYPRILIIRFSAIGDVVRTLPGLHDLRAHYPHAQIDWAIEDKSQDIISENPALDQILVFNRPEGLWNGIKAFTRFCRRLRANRYDIVVDFHGIFKSGVASRATGARERYGFSRPRGRELSPLLANRRVSLPSTHLNRIEENLRLCSATGASGKTLDVIIALPEELEEDIDRYIQREFQGAKRIVAVHAPVDRAEKQWPIPYYAELVDLLLCDGRFEVLLTWGPGQRACVEQLCARSRRNPHIAPETPSLKHYACLVRQCALFVGGDTGPMHIASAMDVPVVAIFGGTSPEKHGPYRNPCRVLYAGPPNLSHNLKPAEAAPFLTAIKPEEVYDAAIRLLKQGE